MGGPARGLSVCFVEIESAMSQTHAGFIDAGYLITEGARALGRKSSEVRPDAEFIAHWFMELPHSKESTVKFLRAYWYDGAFDPEHSEFASQRRYFDAIASVPGIQLRLGHIAERPSRLQRPILRELRNTALGLGIDPEQLLAEFSKHWTFYPERQQKGVDTLIALDMVRLASRSAYQVAIVLSGDRDLAEVVRTVQDYGVQVMVATPNRRSVAGEVLQLVDDVIELTEDELRSMLPNRPARTS